ncbi:MAG: DUF1837 domain-containing protein [Lachnospiraceae bacterium]|jgi:hypothetical protein|nr:DUF1837 domain-containing protein [Lachnospiraceae bacterium]
MSIAGEYKIIYQKEMAEAAGEILCSYRPVFKTYEFRPMRHNCGICGGSCCTEDCGKGLGGLMRRNLVFYCYGEEEIVEGVKNGRFCDLENAALYAYKKRLPKRAALQDGLPGEVLLDLLIQTDEPEAYKLAVRTLFRQDDNNEIKGFDLTYFSIRQGKISLWLGQAKMGTKGYCRGGIDADLMKLEKEYLSRQIYFVADKPVGITEEAKKIVEAINDLNMRNIRKSNTVQAEELLKHFREKDISIKIPCLLAYGTDGVYEDIKQVEQHIAKEIEGAQKYFAQKKYIFEGFTPEILFYVLPLKDLKKLRSDEGFYYGLRE